MNTTFLYYDFIPTLAEYVLDFPKERYTCWGITPKHNYPQINLKTLKDDDIIFVKTDMLQLFFNKFYPLITKKFFLLSGVAGLDVTPLFKKFLDDNKIIKWIGCNICFEHPKVFKIPIGFEEPERCRGGSATNEGGDQKLLDKLYNSRKSIEDKENKLMITYMGKTHFSRNNIRENFKNEDYVYFADKMNFEDYMKTINNYKFVLCPRGSGTDTHRFWEVILMGSIPIVQKDGLYDLYDKFPCIIVTSFEDLTKTMLDNFLLDKEKQKNIDKYLIIDNFVKLLHDEINNNL